MADDVDVFISYAHIDNVSLKKGEPGWITDFHRSLELRLTQLMGEKPKIWRDLKLKGYEEFTEEIIAKIHKAKILVAVISPPYLKSQWCMKELRGFVKASESSGGINPGNKPRIFKIVKTYLPHEEHPDEIRGLLGYDFFHFDQSDEKDRPYEFMPEKGSRYYNEFWEKLEDVAWDIHNIIKEINEPGNLQENPPEKTVYLAETTFDLTKERENIQRSLKQHGYTILPDRSLPLLSKDGNFRDSVREYLKRCKLSIHLIGNRYGPVPEEEKRSIIDLQNELALEQCKNNQLSRLIWMPPGLDKNKIDDRQDKYITGLKNDAPRDKGTKLLATTPEDLKNSIQYALEKIINPPVKKVSTTGPARVYLVCDKEDRGNVKFLNDCLFSKDIEVKLPLFEGSTTQRWKIHKEELALCDALMIYYDHANEYWVRTKLNDLNKAPGFGRIRPLKASTVFITGEKTRHKEQFRTHEAGVIRKFTPFSCNDEDLDSFISQIHGLNGDSR